MRPVVTHTVAALSAIPEAQLEAARSAAPTAENHRLFLRDLAPLHEIESVPARYIAPFPDRLSAAAFNVERLKDVESVRRLLDSAGVHVALLTEVDAGMARSGNRHTIRDLAAERGEGYVYGLEFVELDLGDADEMRRHAGEVNAMSFHGNAILSNLRLERPHLIPLEETGLWFGGHNGAQRRVGGRMALAARLVDAPIPLWVVTVHLESQTDAADRQSQIRALLRGLDSFAAGEACLIGGDLNTKDLPAGPHGQARALADPEFFEPLFEDFRREGFSWAGCNLAAVTQRTGPSGDPEPPFRKLDWLLVRGVSPEGPRVVPALDAAGGAVSDHEMLTVSLSFDPA